ncbi:hypothetical protein MNBD_GAMMA12-3530 [hydrothermal vent metagenome]|uniref:DUF4440 domain-containing protein n=1 Tax=hydrothermal vent metagenome TaxID=652676 RepID=A0A3B0YES5_9ZZZZ
MKNYFCKDRIKFSAILLLLAFGEASAVDAAKNIQCKAEVQHLIGSYQKALNSSNTGKVVSLYTKNGVFMPSNKPTSIGVNQVKTAYQYVFKTLNLNVKFHIDEIECYGRIAFVRTRSDGNIKLIEKNITIKNNSRELFILKRIVDQWKIYRYMFNEIN